MSCGRSPNPAARTSRWWASTISDRSRPTRICSATTRVHGRFPGEVTVKGDTISVGNGAIKVTAIKDPSHAALEGSRRRHRAGMHRHLHREGQGLGASERRRQARAHLRARRQCRSHRRLWRQPRQADQGPHGRLERVLHHQLPRAGGQGAERRGRHRQGLHDHDPRLYRRPADARHHAQGSLSRARGGAVDDPDLDRCRQGGRPRAAGAERQARRRRHPRADAERVGGRFQVRRQEGDQRRTRSTARSSAPPSSSSRASSATPTIPMSRSTSTTTRIPRSSTWTRPR